MLWCLQYGYRGMKHIFLAFVGFCSIALAAEGSASGLDCSGAGQITADLGDGVTLKSCSREQSPGQFIRAGPLELVKNGILILKLQTDLSGKLQGGFTSRDDQGAILESGSYLDGQKHGEWRITAKNGESVTLQFREGIPIAL